MFFYFKNVKINYLVLGDKGKWLVFLHGWGGSVESFLGVAKTFKNNRCLLIDFPPFGFSEEPQDVWDLKTYADMVFSLIQKLKIKKISLISHSFGGRVAILLSSTYNVNVSKLILIDSAGMKPRDFLWTKFKIVKYKFLKKLGFKQKNKGSQDYKSLSPIMKKTFSCIVNQYLEQFCSNINAETLIFSGDKDKTTPLYMAKRLNKLIKNSGLVVLKNAGHFSYLDNFEQFIIIVHKFIN